MHKVALAAVAWSVVASAGPSTPSDEATPVKRPIVGLDEPTVNGALDAEAITVVVQNSDATLLACYPKTATAEVDVSVTFTIGVNGKVNRVATTPISAIAACVTRTVSKLKFAAAKETTTVVYPMKFLILEVYGILGSTRTENGAFESLTGSGSGGFETLTGVGDGGVGGGMARGTVGPPPLVSIGQPTVTGNLDKAIIRRYVKRNVQKLQYCYEKELLVTKTLHGTITAEFTITENGTVDTSTASGIKNKNVESCVAAVIKNIEFPKPKGGSNVTVTYPLTFTPPPPPAKKTK